MTEKHLQQLKQQFSDSILDHVYYNTDPRIGDSDASKWEKEGKPYQWISVCKNGNLEGFVDVAYGCVALFSGDELISTGDSHTSFDEDFIFTIDNNGVPKIFAKLANE